MSELRVYFKPAGSNKEIAGPFYEFSATGGNLYNVNEWFGMYNCRVVNLGFQLGKNLAGVNMVVFHPVDPRKSIILATRAGFFEINTHLNFIPTRGMKNFKPFESDNLIIDCQSWIVGKETDQSYWSVTTEGMTFFYSDIGNEFPGAWKLPDCNTLCDFIAGERTIQNLRLIAIQVKRKVRQEFWVSKYIVELQKTVRHQEFYIASLREKMIEHSKSELDIADKNKEIGEKAKNIRNLYAKLSELHDMALYSKWPFVSRKKVIDMTL